MEAVSMHYLNRKHRAFYRITILPQHIAKREGETKQAYEDELAGWKKFVKDEGLQDELKAFQAQRKAYEDAHEVWQQAKAVSADNTADLEFDFRVKRETYNVEYGNPKQKVAAQAWLEANGVIG